MKDHFYTAFLFVYAYFSLCVEEMLAMVVAHDVIDCTEVIGTVEESIPVLVFRLAPLNFTEGSHARKEHVMEVVLCRDVLCPKVCLYSKNMCLLFISHISCKWLIRVAFLNREVSTDRKRLVSFINRLIIV